MRALKTILVYSFFVNLHYHHKQGGIGKQADFQYPCTSPFPIYISIFKAPINTPDLSQIEKLLFELF